MWTSYQYQSVFTEGPCADCRDGWCSPCHSFMNSGALLANMGKRWLAWEEEVDEDRQALPLEQRWGTAAFGRLEETRGVARKRGESGAGLSDHGQEFVLDPEKLKSPRMGWRILLTCGQGE